MAGKIVKGKDSKNVSRKPVKSSVRKAKQGSRNVKTKDSKPKDGKSKGGKFKDPKSKNVVSKGAASDKALPQDGKVYEIVDESDLGIEFQTTKDIELSKTMIGQVIGQDEAVRVIKKVANQRRHVLLIGEPGTGKSMLGLALAELLPKEKLMDIVSFPNPNDENQPLIRTVAAGQGREIVNQARYSSMGLMRNQNVILFVLLVVFSLLPWWAWRTGYLPDVVYAASLIASMMFLIGIIMIMNIGKKMNTKTLVPKVIVDNFNKEQAPFMDATGAHAGALLGDVLHDPFQSGGLGTPAHERVVAGMIHKAHMGVLFIDEIATLQPHTQQELLTSLQEGKYSITGQSERSAGAMVRTEPVPCRFILVAAGNLETVKHMHPALRSRIRGYGYEVYMNETLPDTPENRRKIAVFVAQEVDKDKKIPHFSREAVSQILNEARKMANRKGHLTLRLRELGGLVRAAGDLAVEKNAQIVERKHILEALKIARTLEQQIADKYIERKKDYEVIKIRGRTVGRVNGLAVMGSGSALSGIILPIEAQVTFGGKENQFIATGKLGTIAKEAVKNVSAIVKRYFGEDIKGKYDIYVQFLQTYEGVEGDSASIAVATAVISALKGIPVKQNFAMTGSLSVRGEVLPVGGVSSKVEAVAEAGIRNVIVPRSNMKDIVLEAETLKKITIIPVDTLSEVLEQALEWRGRQKILDQIIEARKTAK
ncbi:ATP-dependent protease LonB [Candidatus Woesearchaeota archaeon]|nr:ATP-dependent protease LonB [Candidatus Woesearchaeota archaeon]